MRVHLVEFSAAHTRFFSDLLESMPKGVRVTRGKYWAEVGRNKFSGKEFAAKVGRGLSLLLLTLLTTTFPALRPLVRAQLVDGLEFSKGTSRVGKGFGSTWLFHFTLGCQEDVGKAFKRDLISCNPDIVLFAEDSAQGPFLWCSEEASKTGAKTIVIPYVSNMAAEYQSLAFSGSLLYRLKCRLGGQLFPESMIIRERGKETLPFHWLAQAAIHGVDHSSLWLATTNKADLNLISDENDFHRISSKYPRSNRYLLVEPPAASAVINRQRVVLENGTPSATVTTRSGPNVFVLIPPNQFPTACDFWSYSSLLEHFLGELRIHKLKGSTFLASVHPRDLEAFDFSYLRLLGEFRVVESVIDGFAEADMLVSYGSSVETVAEYLEIPILSYNVYGFPHLNSNFQNSAHLSSERKTFGLDFERLQRRVSFPRGSVVGRRKSVWEAIEGGGL